MRWDKQVRVVFSPWRLLCSLPTSKRHRAVFAFSQLCLESKTSLTIACPCCTHWTRSQIFVDLTNNRRDILQCNNSGFAFQVTSPQRKQRMKECLTSHSKRTISHLRVGLVPTWASFTIKYCFLKGLLAISLLLFVFLTYFTFSDLRLRNGAEVASAVSYTCQRDRWPCRSRESVWKHGKCLQRSWLVWTGNSILCLGNALLSCGVKCSPVCICRRRTERRRQKLFLFFCGVVPRQLQWTSRFGPFRD